MVFVEKTIPIIFSSDPANGAYAINQNANEFTVALDTPLSIPKEAVACTLEVRAANVVWVVPNVSVEIGNNQFHFDHEAKTYELIVPDGLYSLSDLSSTLSRQFVEEGLPADLIAFSADNSSQKVVITFAYAGTQIDFTVANSVNTLIGFNSIKYPLLVPSIIGESFIGQSTASFNRVSRFLISCDLVQEGIPTNNEGQQIIASIPITVSPGSTLHYTPYNPVEVNARGLIGNPRNVVRLRLYDQVGRGVDTLGEAFDVLIVIKYSLQMAKFTREHKSKHTSSM